MQNIKKYESIFFKIFCVILFPVGIGFMFMARDYFFYGVVIALLIIFIFYFFIELKEGKSIAYIIFHCFDMREIVLFLAMGSFRLATYYYYSDRTDIKGPIIWSLLPVLFFMIGKLAILNGKEEIKKRLNGLILPFGFGMFVQDCLHIYSKYRDGYVGAGPRAWKTFYGNHDYLTAATFFEIFPLVITALILWAYVSYKEHKLLSIIIWICGIGNALWFYIDNDSKGVLLNMMACFMIGLLIYLVDKYLIKKNKFNKKYIYFLLIFLIIASVIVLINYQSISTWYNSSNFGRDGGIFNNIRFKIQFMCIMDIKNYPFGNNHTAYAEDLGETTHGSWTEVAYNAGAIPFILICIYLFLSLKDIIKLTLSKEIELSEKIICISPFAAYFFYSCIEAPGECFNWFLVMYFGGIIRALVLLENKQLKN